MPNKARLRRHYLASSKGLLDPPHISRGRGHASHTSASLQQLPDMDLAFTYPLVRKLIASAFIVILVLMMRTSFAEDYHGLILDLIKQMVQSGRYSGSHF